MSRVSNLNYPLCVLCASVVVNLIATTEAPRHRDVFDRLIAKVQRRKARKDIQDKNKPQRHRERIRE
jgi:hypothetical protein